MANESREISILSIVLSAIFAILIGIGLFMIVGVSANGPDIWWYFMTVLMGYLLADGFTLLYDRWRSGHRNPLWVPFEFALFFWVILLGALVGQYASAWIVHAFDSPDQLAYVTFFGLDFGLPFLLLFDFAARGRFRRAG